MKRATMLSVLLVLASLPARADEATTKDGPLLLLGVRGGPTTPQLFNRLTTNALFNLEGAWGPSTSGPALFLDLGYTQPVEHGSRLDSRFAASGGTASYTMTVQDLAVGIGALYRLALGGGFTPYLGVGGRVHFTKTTIEQHAGTTDLGTQVETGTRFGVVGRLGLAKTLGPGELALELNLDYAPINDLVTGEKNTGFLGYQLAYQFAL